MAKNTDPECPYVHPSDADIAQFMPTIPKACQVRDDSYYSIEDFASSDPTKYELYRAGLLAEGYSQATDADPQAAGPSVRRKSNRPSGTVYPQDLDWSSKWAKEATAEHASQGGTSTAPKVRKTGDSLAAGVAGSTT